ncbi:flagellar hook-length control protein FliK [Clostridium thermarum]|uniref:flagellar hook-length control protein FliK n=1 Tax=Clostridium thermarum TaxID=1716543 RepID=UPI0013D72312|nr:flagellar hook-length control protein FliK [Clostridium thermarum]
MNVNMPVINIPSNGTDTLSYSGNNISKSGNDQFKALLGELSGIQEKNSSSVKKTITSNISELKVEESEDDLQRKLKDMVKGLLEDIISPETHIKVQPQNVTVTENKGDLIIDIQEGKKLLAELKEETISLEELVMLLARLNLYMNADQSPQGTPAMKHFTADVNSALEDLIRFDTAQAGSSDKNRLLQAIGNLIADEEVPQDIKDLLIQFEILSDNSLEEVQAAVGNNIKAALTEEYFSQKIQNSSINENTEALAETRRQNAESATRINVNGNKVADNEELRELNYLEAKFIKSVDKSQTKLHKFYSMYDTFNSKAADMVEVQSAIEQKAVKITESLFNHLEFPNKRMAVETPDLIGQAVSEEAFPGEKMAVQSDDSLLQNYELETGNSSNKEEKFLEGLLVDKAEVKDDKVTLLMNQIKNVDSEEGDIAVKEKVTVNKSTFVSDIIKSVKFMEKSNLKELRVSIAPKELGEIVITVTLEAGKMKTSIAASNKESYNLLLSNAEEIKGAFSNNEIRIQDFSNSIYNGDTTFFKDGSQRRGNNGQRSGNSGKIIGSGIEEVGDILAEEEDILDSQINILA